MDKTVQSRARWSLTLFRDGSQEDVGKLKDARFRYGRWSSEVEETKIRTLPTGVIRALEFARISSEAMETGFELQMSLHGTLDTGWMPFDIALSVSTPFGPNWKSPRFLYVSPDDESSLNMIQIGFPFCGHTPREPPRRLWIRARGLPLREIVWALENEIFESKGLDQDQMTLEMWADLPEKAPEKGPSELSLPGPPSDPYSFFESER
jgi:hypothetical protein